MNTYNYVDKTGKVKQVQAKDSASAISSATDRDPSSGVQLVSGGNDISKAIPNAGGTAQKAPVIQSDAPTNGGASGRFDGLNDEEAGKVDELYNYASQFGVPSSEIGDFYNDRNYRVPDPPISAEEARIFGRKFGGGNDYAGLTRAQAEAKASSAGQKISPQLSAQTSYSFNSDYTSGAKKILDNFSFKLNENNNDPFKGNGSKTDFASGLLESTANDFAKLFDTTDQFQNALQTDANFKATVDAFTAKGGNIDSIASKITAPASVTVVSYVDNGDGTTTNTLSDGSTSVVRYSQNEDGTMTPTEVSRTQGTQDYLASLSPNATQAQKDAFNTLIPERQIAQDQISQLAGIPKQYRDLYFGTPEAVGLLEEKKILAENNKKILEKKQKDAEDDARESARIAIEKNNNDLEIANAEVETNRLKAKNYMTGMLAKMGALNTTGTAVLSLGILEEKYQAQKARNKATTTYNNQLINSKLTEAVHKLENDKEDDIQRIQTDLSKDKETVIKEIFKVQQTTAKDIFGVMSKYTTALRVQTDKYTAQAKKDADAYTKAQLALLKKGGGGVTNSSTVTNTAGTKNFKGTWSPKLEKSRGTDGYVDPAVYNNAFNAWVDAKGSQKDFILQFPPKNFINPANDTILPAFRTTPKATTKKTSSSSEEIDP